MNVLGHPLLSTEVCSRMNPDLILGSYLPDIVPFVPRSVFEFEEIHEGGLKFLHYLEEKSPDRRDVALGMLCHSAEYGADKYSRMLEERFEEYKDCLGKRIAEASDISLEVAKKARFHNYLWWGFDVQILHHRTNFVEDLTQKITEIEISEPAELLARCFGKDKAAAERDIRYILKPFSQERFKSVRGLAEIWCDVAAGLPEQDNVDVEKTIQIFEDCADLVEDIWEDNLSLVVAGVKDLLESEGISPHYPEGCY